MEEKNAKAELLSPAASFESIRGVINAGADAVYIGGRLFGARAYAENMEDGKLFEAVDYVHLHHKKIYLTVNTLLKEPEMERDLYNYLAPFYEKGLDAVIVQDLGALAFIREQFPNLAIHASTQMTLTGEYAPVYLGKMGVQRIVTPRELSLSEIAAIKQAAPKMEIESFVHGALCMGYSGQCFFSSSLGERSGNRGRCAQPCRLPYSLSDGKRQLARQSFLLSPKDMCAIDILPQLIQAGVYSLKIEGRMKRPEYMAGVTAVYRKYLDLFLMAGEESYQVEESDRMRLLEIYNRGGFHDGYYFHHHGKDMISAARPNHYGVLVGQIRDEKGGMALYATEDLSNKDILEIRSCSIKEASRKSSKKQASGSEGIQFVIKEPIMRGQKKPLRSLINIQNLKNLHKADVFRIHNETLLMDIRGRFLQQDQKINVSARLTVKKEQPLSLVLWKDDIQIKTTGSIVQPALNQAAQQEQLLKQLNKTGNTPFKIEQTEFELEKGCFVALKEINEIRRRALEQLEEALLRKFHREKIKAVTGAQKNAQLLCKSEDENSLRRSHNQSVQAKLIVFLTTKEQAEALTQDKYAYGCYLDINMFSLWRSQEKEQEFGYYHQLVERLKNAGKRVYLSMPAIIRKADTTRFKERQKELFSCVDGVLARNFEQLCFLKSLQVSFNFELIGDYTVYNMNWEADAFLKNFGLIRSAYPLELTERELKALASQSLLERELIFYGYLPMMFCAQCQVKNANLCTHQSQTLYLRDRYNQEMSVLAHCDYCYNTIYNSKPLSLFGLEKQVRALCPDAVRLQFLQESANQMMEIIEEFALCYIQGKNVSSSVMDFTRGHFRRGVE